LIEQLKKSRAANEHGAAMSIWRWNSFIESVAEPHQITLGEGNTPLVRSKSIGASAGLSNLFFKVETSNPAGSFKDRFGAAAVSHMLASGQSRCLATSSGNTGSALAAYCAAAKIECHIAVVETAPESKLRQMMAYGADVFRITGFGIDAKVTNDVFARLDKLAAREDSAIQVSSYIYSPLGMSGVETISHELVEQTQTPIDHVFCQAGGGGLCVAIVRGFQSQVAADLIDKSPAIECVQPLGNNTIAGPMRNGDDQAQECECATNVSGLQVPIVNDGHLVINECRPTGGNGHLVSDEAVWETQQRLAREEGIFSEPAGAVALAGALQAAANGELESDANIVCLVTGSGFKDEKSVTRMIDNKSSRLIEASHLAELE
jgi:threonine synthase